MYELNANKLEKVSGGVVFWTYQKVDNIMSPYRQELYDIMMKESYSAAVDRARQIVKSLGYVANDDLTSALKCWLSRLKRNGV